MYNYPGSYSRPQVPLPPGLPGAPPGFNFPPGTAGPPGVASYPPGVALGAAPPGVGAAAAAPGTAPPGTAQPSISQRPGIGSFVPPTNLPNINFNAPIIRLGTSSTKPQTFPERSGSTSGPAGTSSAGGTSRHHALGGGSAQSTLKDSTIGFQLPSAEEQLKTLFVSSIPKDMDDEWMEKILRATGSLRRWIRVTDEYSARCSFGFAEFEDFENLKIAKSILDGLKIPSSEAEKDGHTLKAVEDDKAHEYLASVELSEEGRDGENGEKSQSSRYESVRTAVGVVVAEFANPERRSAATKLEDGTNPTDLTPATSQESGEKDGQTRPEIVTISLSVDDELSDIPADMREVVAKEIAAFRERSNRRDLERIKREEEIERQERDRSSHGRSHRYSSPPVSAPTGPSAGPNAIPVGPSRMRADAAHTSAPTQPSRMANGSTGPSKDQIPNGTKFVNETSGGFGRLPQEEDDSDASDSELEKRRKAKKMRETESIYIDHERRWNSREKSRTSAVDREANRDRDEKRRLEDEKVTMSKRLEEWDDDIEAERKIEDYYIDHSQWIRNRAQFRAREKELDERDKAQEQRQKEIERKTAAESAAESFLARQEEELENLQTAQAAQAQPKIKLSLGASARSKATDSARPRRTVADVEGLLEDEEEDASKAKRVLIPIQYDESSTINEEKRDEMVKSLAQEIPADKEGLFGWDVKWEFIDEAIIKGKLQPFVEKKIVEYLGVQEQELIDFVLEHVRKRGTAETLVNELKEALDEDAEVLVKKIWRMLVFFSESEKRGLGP